MFGHLSMAERHKILQKIADEAAATVRRRHKEAGIDLIYMKDGVIVREAPDGTITPIKDGGID